jgi:hypothetical protein
VVQASKGINAKYDIHNDDVHHFNKIGFQIGIISSIKVVTGVEIRAQPELVRQAIASRLQLPRESSLLRTRPRPSSYTKDASTSLPGTRRQINCAIRESQSLRTAELTTCVVFSSCSILMRMQGCARFAIFLLLVL